MKPINEGGQDASNVSTLTCAQRLMDVVPYVMQAFREEMRNHRSAEFSIPEFRTLSYIQRHQGTSAATITEHIGLSKASLSKIVTRLEQRNLIKRGAAKEDKRYHALTLTAHGQRTLDDVEVATLRSIAGRLSPLSPEDARGIVSALNLLEPFFVGQNV